MAAGRASEKRRRDAARAAGQCRDCPNPAAPGRTRCESCLAKCRDQKTRNARVAAMRLKQHGKCSICGKVEPPTIGGKRSHLWVEDHDHVTGLVRGAAHDGCNKGIGLLGDDPERLQHAATYILWHRVRHEAKGALA